MKKKILQYSILSLVLFSSCTKDEFDILPDHQDTPETAFSTEEGFRNVLDGAYDAFKGGAAYGNSVYYNSDGGSSIIMGDVLTDNIILNPLGRTSNSTNYKWELDSQKSVTYLYSAAYRVVSVANNVLANMYRLPASPFMTNIEAEAKAIRAIAHFDIVRAYAKIPTQSADANASLGIAYVSEYDPHIKPSRLTVSESYNKILEDLNYALNNINDSNEKNGGVGRLNKLSVLGMLNRVYLYMGEWDKVIETGNQIIAEKPSVGSIGLFSNIWNDSSSDGVLFKILNNTSGGDKVTVGNAYNQFSPSGIKSEYVVDYALYLQFKNSDVRKDAYITTAFYEDNKIKYKFNNITKHSFKAGSDIKNVVDIKYLRTAEIYLNMAEAYLKKGDDGNALALLNVLRIQRYNPYTPGIESGQALKDAVDLERRLELAFENDRFYTLKRQGKDIVRSNFGPYADGSGGVQTSILFISSTSYKFQFPLPQSAIIVNTNLVQNPEYN